MSGAGTHEGTRSMSGERGTKAVPWAAPGPN
eukprot:CAMPEP_0182906952 /NCGR_PEP_ID=MMETSP0034_2-20130328/34135_1 /TAXON_ID=156128 /ORGANISM="Nephroselmis pyriformis, Strain CCMP717" /LENGTH=30 /DNA_ID= /DNA_START= /DNA_END= /DNA_ORIENTATION=